jgi:hypothetical protein
MSFRTTKSSVSFRAPFTLQGVEGKLPAGTYDIETDEELVTTSDRTAYRRIATLIHIRTLAMTRTFAVQPQDLKAALERDSAGVPANDATPTVPPSDQPWRSVPLWVASTPALIAPRSATDINHALAEEQIALEKAAGTLDPEVRDQQDRVARHHGAKLHDSGFPHRPYRRNRSLKPGRG